LHGRTGDIERQREGRQASGSGIRGVESQRNIQGLGMRGSKLTRGTQLTSEKSLIDEARAGRQTGEAQQQHRSTETLRRQAARQTDSQGEHKGHATDQVRGSATAIGSDRRSSSNNINIDSISIASARRCLSRPFLPFHTPTHTHTDNVYLLFSVSPIPPYSFHPLLALSSFVSNDVCSPTPATPYSTHSHSLTSTRLRNH
jgi:hypothetical protein